MCLKIKPTLDLKQEVFPRNKLKIPNSRGEKIDDYERIIEFLPNLRDFPISRDVGLGVGNGTSEPERSNEP